MLKCKKWEHPGMKGYKDIAIQPMDQKCSMQGKKAQPF